MLARNIIPLIALNGLALARKQKSEYLPASAIAKVSTIHGHPHVSVVQTHPPVSMIARSFSEHDPSHFSHGPVPTDAFASKGATWGPGNGDQHHTFNTVGAETGNHAFFAGRHKSSRAVETGIPDASLIARDPAPTTGTAYVEYNIYGTTVVMPMETKAAPETH